MYLFIKFHLLFGTLELGFAVDIFGAGQGYKMQQNETAQA